MYRRVVEVYGITTVARSSAIVFGWCICVETFRRWWVATMLVRPSDGNYWRCRGRCWAGGNGCGTGR